MGPLFEAVDVHAAAWPREALILAVCAVGAVWAARKLGGTGLGALIAACQLSSFVLIGHVAVPAAVAMAMVLAANRRSAAVSAREFAGQFVLLWLGLIAYQVGRIATRSDSTTAYENGRAIIDFEKQLGVYFEPDIQDRVMQAGPITTLVNDVYSFGFLAAVVGSLVYLLCCDRGNFRLLRNSLGISALLAVGTIAIFPAAPPRLLSESGLADTVIVAGRSHNFTNEFAAVPSLHVGWMALTGWVLARSIGGRWRRFIAVIPGLSMGIVVVATGNHFWVDAVVGTTISVGPAVVLASSTNWTTSPVGRRVQEWRPLVLTALSTTKTRVSVLGMLGLLTYLVVGQVVAPGFTAFWGYLVFQMAATLVLLLVFEVVFAREGGVSWTTLVVAISCGYLDVFGTSGDLYAKIDEYDKITHFMGVAALTSGTYDILRGLHLRGLGPSAVHDRLMASVAVGTAVGIAWEVYEFLGDRVFHSARVQGRWDTANDLLSDFLGAVTVALVLAWAERQRVVEPGRESAAGGEAH